MIGMKNTSTSVCPCSLYERNFFIALIAHVSSDFNYHLIIHSFVLGHIKKFLVSRPSAHYFWRAHQEDFIFRNLCTLLFFSESRSILSFILIKIHFYSILRCASMIEIHFSWYVEIVKLFLSQKTSISPCRKDEKKK